MFAYALILILLLPIAFLPLILEIFFSPDELTEMGIRLDTQQAGEIS